MVPHSSRTHALCASVFSVPRAPAAVVALELLIAMARALPTVGARVGSALKDDRFPSLLSTAVGDAMQRPVAFTFEPKVCWVLGVVALHCRLLPWASQERRVTLRFV